MTLSIGLIVNPVAGVGGTVGLKGSDGADVQSMAFERGAVAHSAERSQRALSVIAQTHPDTTILTAARDMGETSVLAEGLTPDVVYRPSGSVTSGADTTKAASALALAGVGLILFAGGDGTARDICGVDLAGAAVLGVPSGVKMYSACFAVSPVAAGAIASRWLTGERLPVSSREVLDVDEEQIRNGRVHAVLYGMLAMPVVPGRTQSRKSATSGSQLGAVRTAAAGAVARMEQGVTYVLGPGGTIDEIARLLEVDGTLLGADAVRDGHLVLADATERQLLELVGAGPSKAVLTVIGGQGFLLGRGNQQISAAVLREIGDDPLMVVATQEKLIDLRGRPLLVETGDPELDAMLAGYAEVVTGPRTTSLYPVSAPESEGPI
ncbi:MAG: ATP-NAD kinase family protein [Acidimicrobiia bacterium]|nr:ATP-NAD kinase family protein [Acidimicrobiia bacterium]